MLPMQSWIRRLIDRKKLASLRFRRQVASELLVDLFVRQLEDRRVLNGSIEGLIWNDFDQDGLQDSGESGIDDVTVELFDAQTNALLETTTTTGGGAYRFDNLPASTYDLRFNPTAQHDRFSPQGVGNGSNQGIDSDADHSGLAPSIAVTNGPVVIDAGLFDQTGTLVEINPDGNLSIIDYDGVDNDISISFDQSTGEIIIGDPAGTLETPGTQGLSEVRIGASLVTGGQILVKLADGNDNLTVDNSLGTAGLSGAPGVIYEAGDPTTLPGDSITVSGQIGTVEFDHTSPSDGTITMDGFVISYVGTEPVLLNNGTLDEMILNLPGNADDAILEDNGVLGDGLSQIRSQNGTFETTIFLNPATSLTINMGDDAGTLTIDELPDFDAALSIVGEGDVDTVNVNADPFSESLNISSELINLNSSTITTVQGQTYDGAVSMLRDVTLTGTVIEFTGTIDGSSALAVDASDTISIGGEIGGSVPLGSFTTLGAATVLINADITTAPGSGISEFFAFAGETFDQTSTPNQFDVLPVGVLTDGDGVTITNVPTGTVGANLIVFPEDLTGFNGDLSLGRQLDGTTGSATALNIPGGNDGTTDRSGFVLTWDNGRTLANVAGQNDFVIYESSGGFPDAFIVQVHEAGGSWSEWVFLPPSSFALYPGKNSGATATAFNLDLFGIADGGRIDAIRVINMSDRDRIDDDPSNPIGMTSTSDLGNPQGAGIVLINDNGSNSDLLPDPGNVDAGDGILDEFTAFEFDPDPLYVGVLRSLGGGTGNQTYNNPVVLTNDAVLTGSNVTFHNSVDSQDSMAFDLTVNTPGGGTTQFNGSVGSSTPDSALGSITTDGPGTTEIGGDINTSGGTMTFGDEVLLISNVVLTDSGTSGVTFQDTVDSQDNMAFSLTVNTPGGGVTRFDGEVGGKNANSALGSLTTDAAGTTEIGADITTVPGSGAPEIFSFATFSFDQSGTPEQFDVLPVGVLVDGQGVIITGEPLSTVPAAQIVFPDDLPGFDGDLSFGRQLDGTTGSATAINLPAGNDGTTDRSGFVLTWTNGRSLPNLAGDDFVIYESSGGSLDAFIVQVHQEGGGWSQWVYLPADSFDVYDGHNSGATATAFDLDLFGVAAGGRVDAIRVVNMSDSDRIDESAANPIGQTSTSMAGDRQGAGLVLIDDGGTTSMLLPDPGNVNAGDGMLDEFGPNEFDPDPLYLGVFHPFGGPTGNQTFNDAVKLLSSATLTGQNVAFNSTLDSQDNAAFYLNVNARGITSFVGTVGQTLASALGSLTTDAPGSTQIGGDITTVGGTMTFQDQVLLTGNANLTDHGGTGVTFDSTVDSQDNMQYELSVSTPGGGVIQFEDEVGTKTPNSALGSLTTDGDTEINTSEIVTTGNQTYLDQVTLGLPSTSGPGPKSIAPDVTLTGHDIIFHDTLDTDASVPERALLINATGVTQFNGVVGGMKALASLETDDATGVNDWTEINTASITTIGDQFYNDPVTLGVPMMQPPSVCTNHEDVTLHGLNVTFKQTLDTDSDPSISQQSLLINATGLTLFNGAVGATKALATLETDDAAGANDSTQINSPSITTIGYQTYNDPVTLGEPMGQITSSSTADVVLSGTDISFRQTLDTHQNAMPRSLLVNASGLTLFSSVVGGIKPLGGLETDDAPGVLDFTQFTTNSVATTGDQIYNDPVLLDVPPPGPLSTTLTPAQYFDFMTDGGNVEFLGEQVLTLFKRTTITTYGGSVIVDARFDHMRSKTGDMPELIIDALDASGQPLGDVFLKQVGGVLEPFYTVHIQGNTVYDDAVGTTGMGTTSVKADNLYVTNSGSVGLPPADPQNPADKGNPLNTQVMYFEGEGSLLGVNIYNTGPLTVLDTDGDGFSAHAGPGGIFIESTDNLYFEASSITRVQTDGGRIRITAAGEIFLPTDPGEYVLFKTATGQTVRKTPPLVVEVVQQTTGSDITSSGLGVIRVTIDDPALNDPSLEIQDARIMVFWNPNDVAESDDLPLPGNPAATPVAEFSAGLFGPGQFDIAHVFSQAAALGANEVPVTIVVSFNPEIGSVFEAIEFFEGGGPEALSSTALVSLSFPGLGSGGESEAPAAAGLGLQTGGGGLEEREERVVAEAAQQTVPVSVAAEENIIVAQVDEQQTVDEEKLFFVIVFPDGTKSEEKLLKFEFLEKDKIIDLFKTFPNNLYEVYYQEAGSNVPQLLYRLNVYENKIVPPRDEDVDASSEASEEDIDVPVEEPGSTTSASVNDASILWVLPPNAEANNASLHEVSQAGVSQHLLTTTPVSQTVTPEADQSTSETTLPSILSGDQTGDSAVQQDTGSELPSTRPDADNPIAGEPSTATVMAAGAVVASAVPYKWGRRIRQARQAVNPYSDLLGKRARLVRRLRRGE